MVNELLPSDKVSKHEAFFNIQPLPTYGLISQVKQVYKSVFDPKKKRIEFEPSEGIQDDTYEYLKDIHFKEFIECDVFESFWSDYGGFLVVDFPEMQLSDKAEPYPYLVNINDVVLYDYDFYNDDVAYLIYKRGDKIIYLDDVSFVVFEGSDHKLVGEFQHNVGQIPAAKLFTVDSIISSEAGNLNYALFKVLDAKKLYNVNSNPITWYYKSNCSYNEGQSRCISGKMHTMSTDAGLLPTGRDCPKCSKDLSGAGTVLKVPMPEGDEKALGQPIDFVFPKVENLKHNADYARERMSDIITVLTGGDAISSMGANNQAFNEKQVSAIIETRRALLTWFGEQIARIEGIAIELIANGRNTVKTSVTVSYGNEFFNVTEGSAYQLYYEAVQNDASINMRTQLYKDWIETKNKQNERGLLRDRMIADLCPFFYDSEDKVLKRLSSGLARKQDVILRTNFHDILEAYESGKAPIQALTGEYDTNIANIKTELYNIVKTYQDEGIGGNQEGEGAGQASPGA